MLRLQTEGFCMVEVGDKPFMIRPGNLLLCSPDDSYQRNFAHYTHFNRLFRSRFQLSPSEYKKLAAVNS
ncbi:hypothetical protein [Paenibacillus chungangensis]|uniref:HTH araC/xylS-type domain-containing protein n=1 Tax=Paenibacillus chungangensis TaxID=696535 RepID=A0ABW3HLP8_9BACL